MARKDEPKRLPSRFLGSALAREAAALVLTYHLYPLGWVGKKTPLLSAWRKAPKKHVPILFVHGIFHNRSAFTWLVQRLAARGFRRFQEMDLSTARYSIAELAEQVAAEVEVMRRQYGVEQIDIIGHSLGGLVSRYYVQKLGGDGKVRYLFTLGSTHQGTPISRLSLIRHIRELGPESKTMAQLRKCPPPKITVPISISGNLDVFTRQDYWWDGARNIHLQGVGHAGILFSKRVAAIILTHLDPAD